MKINCGRSTHERSMAHRKEVQAEALDAEQWHPVFAWWPVRVARKDCRWLETIEQRYTRINVVYDYSKWWHPWKFWMIRFSTIECRAVPEPDLYDLDMNTEDGGS